MRFRYPLAMAASLGLGATVVCGVAATAAGPPAGGGLAGIHKIKHVVVLMQENRSFDSYFGTYPHADGIPMKDGVPTVCVPDPRTGQCVKPYVDHADSNSGGPNGQSNSAADIDGGKMDGFISQAQDEQTTGPPRPGAQHCQPTGPCPTDVMGYHTASDIPNYWAYANNFVLQDHMFDSVHSWSFPSHLAAVSGWSATCTDPDNPMSCSSDSDYPDHNNPPPNDPPTFAWTDLTYLLHKYHVSWGYYLDHGMATGSGSGGNSHQTGVPSIWDPLPGFTDVHEDDQTANVQNLSNFYTAAKNGTLPAVSWIAPEFKDSEHPNALISTGQAYTTKLINAIMRSPDWDSTAIFLEWDDWSGFYDHVIPPIVDAEGYGLRVPAMTISPYAKAGYVDHQTLSYDAYLKFIEDDFLHSARLDPATDGRPDSRPDVREDAPQLGNLVRDFNFHQKPRPPLILDPCPQHTTLTPKPSPTCDSLPPGGVPADLAAAIGDG